MFVFDFVFVFFSCRSRLPHPRPRTHTHRHTHTRTQANSSMFSYQEVSHKQLRARTWPNHTPLEKKLYGTTEELALTVDYIVASGLTVRQTAAGRTKKKKKKISGSDPSQGFIFALRIVLGC